MTNDTDTVIGIKSCIIFYLVHVLNIIRTCFCHCCVYIFLVFIVIQVDGCGKSELGKAIMYNFTSYANGIHGLEFSVVGNIKIIGFKLADNRDNGIEIQETLGVWGGAVIQVHNYVLLLIM